MSDNAEFSGLWDSSAFKCLRKGALPKNMNVVTEGRESGQKSENCRSWKYGHAEIANDGKDYDKIKCV